MSENVICVRIIGGLGNQMFQYAAGSALAKRYGAKLVLDVRGYKKYKLHDFSLDHFRINAEIGTLKELKPWPLWKRWVYRVTNNKKIFANWYFEPNLAFDPRWESLKNNLMLDGYFQSYKYFSDIEHELRSIYVPLKELSIKNKQLVHLAQSTESVMIHVRRGNYISNPRTLKIHGVCSAEYYRNAISTISKSIKSPRFFVFSNDMDWVQKHLQLNSDTIYISGEASEPEVDIYLMSQCKSHIIANSTFSWWGAWLANYKKKRVIAPTPWFGSLRSDSPDLIPAGWNQISRL